MLLAVQTGRLECRDAALEEEHRCNIVEVAALYYYSVYRLSLLDIEAEHDST